MLHRRLFSVLAASMLWSVVASAQQAPIKIGVLDFDGSGLSKEFLAEGSKAIRDTLVGSKFVNEDKSPKFTVVTGDKLSNLTGLLACAGIDEACLKQIANRLKASMLVYGTVKTPQKGIYDVELSLFDGSKFSSLTKAGVKASQFSAVVAGLASELFGVAPLAYVSLDANIKEASVTVDGVAQTGTLPMLLELPPGKHTVVMSAPEYTPVEQEIDLVVGEPKNITVVLSKQVTGEVPPLAKGLTFGGGAAAALGLAGGTLWVLGSLKAGTLLDGKGNFDPNTSHIDGQEHEAIQNQLELENREEAPRICSKDVREAVAANAGADSVEALAQACRFEKVGVPALVLGVGGAVSVILGVRMTQSAVQGEKSARAVAVSPYIGAGESGVVLKLRW